MDAQTTQNWTAYKSGARSGPTNPRIFEQEQTEIAEKEISVPSVSSCSNSGQDRLEILVDRGTGTFSLLACRAGVGCRREQDEARPITSTPRAACPESFRGCPPPAPAPFGNTKPSIVSRTNKSANGATKPALV